MPGSEIEKLLLGISLGDSPDNDDANASVHNVPEASPYGVLRLSMS